jgi:hypothetical protein
MHVLYRILILIPIFIAWSSVFPSLSLAELGQELKAPPKEEQKILHAGEQQEASHKQLWSLGVSSNLFYQKKLNGLEYDRRVLPSLEIGYTFSTKYRSAFDYLYNSQREGSQTFEVKEKRHDFNLWFMRTGQRARRLSLWIGGGLGWSYQSVSNRLYSETLSSSTSDLFRLGLRADAVFWLTSKIFLDANFRVYFWNVRPSSSFSLGVMLGYFF